MTETVTTQEIVDIFQSSYTEQLYDRKAAFISKLCEDRPNGFFYGELENLIKIIQLLLDDYADGQVPLPT